MLYKINEFIEIYLAFNYHSFFTVALDSYWNYQFTKMDDADFQFKCEFCEKSFFNEEILGLHIIAHSMSRCPGS